MLTIVYRNYVWLPLYREFGVTRYPYQYLYLNTGIETSLKNIIFYIRTTVSGIETYNLKKSVTKPKRKAYN